MGIEGCGWSLRLCKTRLPATPAQARVAGDTLPAGQPDALILGSLPTQVSAEASPEPSPNIPASLVALPDAPERAG